MEESKEETFDYEMKMGEVAPRNPVLEVSVSFGRFEGDSLSWEKWSSFSPNKYLEEVEKCATPGSVAEKKAYFEEHYKKIAAKKAELLVESKSFKSDDLARDGGESSVEKVKEESGLNGEVNGVHNDVSNEEAEAVAVGECPSLSVEGEMEENAVSEKACDSLLDKEEMSLDLEKDEDKEETEKIKEENKKLDHGSRSRSNKNTTAVKKGVDTKMISSTPRTSTSATITTTKGGAVSSLTRTKNRSMQESKKMASKSLHVSLNLDSFGSNSAPPATTKGGAVSSSTRTKNPSMRASKKLAPKSLHMSLNLDPGSNSAPLVTTSTKGGTRNPSKQKPKKVAPKTLHKSLNLDPSGSVSAKGGTDSSATRTKVPSMQESKKVAPKSLHMSLNLEPSGSNSTPLTTSTKSHGISSTRGGTFSSPTRTKNPSMREGKKATPKSLHMSLNLDPSISAPLATTTNPRIVTSTKGRTVSSSTRTKNPSRPESKNVDPKSLHMSLNLEPSGPNSAPPTTANISITITSTIEGAVITSSTRTEDHSMRGSKKVDSNSLHISLNLDPSESKDSNPPPPTTTRKSLVMEKMGDKDIVKRAFKTFQNKNNNQLEPSSEEQSTSPKQVAVKGTEPQVSTIKTPQKENGGSVRTGRMEKRTDKNAPPQSGLKNDESAEKRKEISKKLEEISHSRETARTRLQTKSKEDKEAEIRKLSETFTFKARPMPAFYRGQKLSKSYIDKDTKKHDAQ